MYFCCCCLFSLPNLSFQPHHMSRPSHLSSQMPLPHHPRQLLVGCCVPPSNGGYLRPSVRPSLSFFLINLTPQTMDNRPLHMFCPSVASPTTHHLMLTSSSIWWLFILIRGQPPKAKAPPLSLLFDASYFAPPREQTNDNKRNPEGSWPACGVVEQRRHDLVAPLLYAWRERVQAAGG